MLSKTLSVAAVAFAASSLVSAQTFTDCNPLERDDCPDDEAFGNQAVDCDWTSPCDEIEELPGTTLSYSPRGALFSIARESNAPTVATHKRIFGGRVDVELRAAPGQGIVTSIVLESQCLDEVDWEFVGGDASQVQSNYFGKGDTTTYDRVQYHPVSDPFGTYHTYSVDWTEQRIQWLIDGEVVRTLLREEAQGGTRYPQTPMEVKLGTWVAGRRDAPEGTVEWAGGYADFQNGPAQAWYRSVNIVDYAGGNSPASSPVERYVWTDNSGEWDSIRVVRGDGSSDDNDDDEDDTSSSRTRTHSSTRTSSRTHETSTAESTSEHTSHSRSPSATPTTTSAATPTSSSDDSGSETSGSDAPETTEGSEGSEGAAAGLFSSFGSVAAAGVVAVLVAQLF